MKNSTIVRYLLLSTASLSVLGHSVAFAAGTTAGTSVQNTFKLDYKVGSIDQPSIDTSASGTNSPTEFTVDRRIDLTVTSLSSPSVTPGAQDQELTFKITNDGNDTQAYALTTVNETGDEFSVTNTTILYYIDDGDGTFEPGAGDGTAQTYDGIKTTDLAADATLFVVIQGDIPTTANDGDTDQISLVADTLEPSTQGAGATPVVADTDGNSLTGDAENVLADGSGTANENANEGDHSATGTFTIASADVSAAKTVSVFSQDGTGCETIPGTPATGDQYAIPGACVEYVITVENAGGTAATDVVINDVLPSELKFIAATSGGFTGGSFTSPALPAANTDCNAGACVINYTGATLGAGSQASPTTATIKIRALVK